MPGAVEIQNVSKVIKGKTIIDSLSFRSEEWGGIWIFRAEWGGERRQRLGSSVGVDGY